MNKVKVNFECANNKCWYHTEYGCTKESVTWVLFPNGDIGCKDYKDGD
jgi:hypothetical protein